MAQPSSTLDESDLRSLLADPRLPQQPVARGDEGFRHVLVWRLVALAEAQLGYSPDLEARVDAAVKQAGGRRLDMIDPWRWLPDLFRRIVRRPLPLREDLYAIPEALFR